MNKSAKLILAVAAAAFTFASCASHKQAPAPTNPAPVTDGGVYSNK